MDHGTRLGVPGLEMGGVVMLTVGFATDEPNLLLGGGAAVAVALVISLLGSVVLDL